jgi:hypothetical protein
MLSKNSLLNIKSTKIFEKKDLSKAFEKQLIKINLNDDCCISDNNSMFFDVKKTFNNSLAGFSLILTNQRYSHQFDKDYNINSNVDFLKLKKQETSVGVLQKLRHLVSTNKKRTKNFLILSSPTKGGFNCYFMGILGFIYKAEIRKHVAKKFRVWRKSLKRCLKVKKNKKYQVSFRSIFILCKIPRVTGSVRCYYHQFPKKKKGKYRKYLIKSFSSTLRFFFSFKKKKKFLVKDK